MAKEGNLAATPKLRFPEFRESGGWKSELMRKLYSFMRNNALSRDKLNYQSGSVKNVHYGDIHTKFSALFDIKNERVPFVNNSEDVPDADSEDYCVEGDIIFADASEDTNDVGKSIEIVRLNGERLLSGQHTILARRKDGTFIVGFGGHLFQSGQIRLQIKREAQGTKVYAISSGRLANIEVAYPSEEGEQKKITDCLTSLDEVIAAQGRKVEALKAHKRGLMQRLFPREDETRPRLRFPEFRDEQEWTETPIGGLGEVVTGSTPSTGRKEYYGGEHLFVSPVDISDMRFVKSTKTTLTKPGFAESREIPERSALFVCIGSTIGKVAQNAQVCATNQQINSVIANSAHDGDFVYYLLLMESDRISELAGKQAVPIINKTLFSSVKVTTPKRDEQRRIADCLSALDAWIAAESEKLDALKTHKKGLMQQLFPSPEAD